MTVRVVAGDADATRAYGAALAGVLRAGDLVVLTGGLGAGKTTLTQGVGAGLGVRGPVVSPTFTIARLQPSLTGGPALVHVDAYRLGSPDGGLDVSTELEALDLDASLDSSVTVVEWGAGWVEALTDDRLEVNLERPRGSAGADDWADDALDAAAGPRVITVRGIGSRWSGVELPGGSGEYPGAIG
ncbi:MAG: tRNA (adenosine(37)-N6)-threonylcarbamoyltransferase complex ATPase subunit type 1 TsaE [Micrococcales bacterium]|nr:tRNA (adenosine(37)-N6)-threonylcarbamoyltransferase complex ATPase subunit type 1 TsaE [Micrococcales bacterium]